MKALQVQVKDGTHEVNLVDLPKPSASAGCVLVKVRASAVQPSDLMNSRGGFPHTHFPRVIGRDYSGVVVEPKDSPLHGREIYGTSGNEVSFEVDGAWAEYVLLKENAVAMKPKTLSFVRAASVCTSYATAFLVLRRTGARKGETVMVLGATGAVGTAVGQVARARGCRVITVSRQESNDINLTEDPELKGAKELTGGRGPDVAIDAIGDVKLAAAALGQLAVEGRLGVISVGQSASSMMPVDVKMLYRAEHSIVGCNSVVHSAEDMARELAEMAPMFESGELQAPDESGLY